MYLKLLKDYQNESAKSSFPCVPSHLRTLSFFSFRFCRVLSRLGAHVPFFSHSSHTPLCHSANCTPKARYVTIVRRSADLLRFLIFPFRTHQRDKRNTMLTRDQICSHMLHCPVAKLLNSALETRTSLPSRDSKPHWTNVII